MKAKSSRRVASTKATPKAARSKNKRSGIEAGPDLGDPASEPHALLGMAEAIALLKTTRPTFYRWLREGRIKAMKVGRQWRFYRQDIDRFLQGAEPRVDVSGDLGGFLEGLADRLRSLKLKVTAPRAGGGIAEAVERLLRLGVALGASDVHVEPPNDRADGRAQVRVRLDGVLHPLVEFDGRVLPALVDRLKTLAGCDVQQKRRPQDGRIRAEIDGDTDVRACFLPALCGEAVTLRILRRGAMEFSFDRIGFAPADLEKLKRAVAMPWGIVIVTGPTGSGKTTTLYAALESLDRARRKVLTIEDPVEATFPNMIQIPVQSAAGLTFATALRSCLRSDPDVVMVGEIRDLEVLQLIQQTALTGHLVFTTLHAEDSARAMTRMLDLGSDPFLLADATRLIVAQRMLRKVCPACSQPMTPDPESARKAEQLCREGGLEWSGLPARFRKPVGCKACAFTGYRGRTIIAEALPLTPEMGAAVRAREGAAALRRLAVSQGMTTLAADAIRRAAEGVATLDEALRVVAGA